jgi:hypothetical protein
VHVDDDAGVLLREVVEHRRDDGADGGLEGAEHDGAGHLLAQGGDRLPCLQQLGLDALGGLGQHAARRGESDAARAAVENGDAFLRLQPGDLLGHRGRGDMQKICCREHAPGPVDGKEKGKSPWVGSHVEILTAGSRRMRLC